MYASISADIVSSTSLSRRALVDLNKKISECLRKLERQYDGFWGRFVRGDTIECIMDHPEDAFEIALILKSWIKSLEFEDYVGTDIFNKYGVRIAIGIGTMNIVDRKLDIMDGDAIYRSGRGLDRLVGRRKYAMTISMSDKNYERPFKVMLLLINHILNNATSRKCELLAYRLLSSTTLEAAEKIGISVSGLNQTLNDMGWYSIEKAIIYYRKTIQEHVL